jgi:hypothetical protein
LWQAGPGGKGPATLGSLKKIYLEKLKNGGIMEQCRQLTYDERKAAEAAFQGAPFDPKLSESARKVYLGISSAMSKKRNEAFQEFGLTQPVTRPKRATTEFQVRPRAKTTLW